MALIDWKRYIPCDVNNVVPTDIRPDFQDLVTLTGGLILPKYSANPTGIKAGLGSLFYNTSDDTLYYRSSAGFQALGVSGTPAPSVFPIQATSASNGAIILESTVSPETFPTYQFTADGTHQYLNGAGLLLAQLRYDDVQDRLVWEDTAGGYNGKMTVGQLLANTSLSTPTITTSGTDISLSNKNLTSVGNITSAAITATSGTLSGTLQAVDLVGTNSLTVPSANVSTLLTVASITSSTTGISFNSKNFTNVGSFSGTTGTFSTSISTPVLTSPTTDISVSSKNFTNINALTAASLSLSAGFSGTTGTFSTSLSTPALTNIVSIGAQNNVTGIDFGQAQLSNVNILACNQIATVLAGQDLRIWPANNGLDLQNVNIHNLRTMSMKQNGGNELAIASLYGTDVAYRFSLFSNGKMRWTDGGTNAANDLGNVVGILPDWTTSVSNFGLNICTNNPSTPDASGTLFVNKVSGGKDGFGNGRELQLMTEGGAQAHVYLAPGSGGKVFVQCLSGIQNVSGDFNVTAAGNNLNLVAQTAVVTAQPIKCKQVSLLYGMSSSYSVPPIVLYNNRVSYTSNVGETIHLTFTFPGALMASQGDSLQIQIEGSHGTFSSTANRQIKIYFNNTSETINLNTNSGYMWIIDGRVTRSTSTVIDQVGSMLQAPPSSGTVQPCTWGNAAKGSISPALGSGTMTVQISTIDTVAAATAIRRISMIFWPQATATALS